MNNPPEPGGVPSESKTASHPSRVRLTTTVEQWAFSAGAVTGTARALLADVANAIKNSGRAFSDAHRKAYSREHAVRRKL